MPGLFAGKEEAICYSRDSIFICSPPPDSLARSQPAAHTQVYMTMSFAAAAAAAAA